VLRGGGGRSNYDAVSIAVAERELSTAQLPANIVVDCSHGNSNKDAGLQPLVAENCVAQITDGNRSIVGLMLESHLHAGNQPIPKDLGDARVRRVDHRSVHRLGDHGTVAAEAACGAASRSALNL
jgi:3-deoxy-7-phosphoheptulonate synthase